SRQNNVSHIFASRLTHQTTRSLLTAFEVNPILRSNVNASLEIEVDAISLSNAENSLEILRPYLNKPFLKAKHILNDSTTSPFNSQDIVVPNYDLSDEGQYKDFHYSRLIAEFICE
ncbi:15384_t:CDS:2, partial [Funneliformis geosporum]